jgi:nitroimidazol reductase NimA-like FMN-containing flavoprotein (pyridoxamine 5'-phosphate oxidase superfamily)
MDEALIMDGTGQDIRPCRGGSGETYAAAVFDNGSGLDVLSRTECLRLLATAKVGRVVYTEGGLPAVTPVNFALDGTVVVFRTAMGSRLAVATEGAVVAFEVNRIDEDSQRGWSVVVTGVAEPVSGTSEMLRVEELGLVSWAGGERSHYVRIVPAVVSGRRVVVRSETIA